MKKTVVVLSGGQDSTTCLGIAKKEFPNSEIHAITFNYGQRHIVEIEAAKKICSVFGINNHKIIDVGCLKQISNDSSLLNDSEITLNSEGLPTSIVHGRNLIFITLAACYARKIGAGVIYTGVCETDFSGYPDCRDDTIKALQVAINLGMESSIEIRTPLMWLTKGEAVKIAIDADVYDLLKYSITCYNGKVPGCGKCPSCVLRAKGFSDAGIPDPAIDDSMCLKK